MNRLQRVRRSPGTHGAPVRLLLLSITIAMLLLTALLVAACRPRAAEVSQAPTIQTTPIVVTSEPTVTAEAQLADSPTSEGTATFTPEPTETATPSITPTATATRVPKSVKETENILVMGIDPRPGDRAWRTDTIMIVAIDYEANQVGIVSLPRDLWVEIPGYGMGRINQADFEGESLKYPGGGPALLGKVIEDNIGIPTHHWVRIRQEGLVQLVDALGGVTVTPGLPAARDHAASEHRGPVCGLRPAGRRGVPRRRGCEEVRNLPLQLERLLPREAPAAAHLGHPRTRRSNWMRFRASRSCGAHLQTPSRRT